MRSNVSTRPGDDVIETLQTRRAHTAKRARLEHLETGPPHTDYLHFFGGLIVSTTWVFGLAFAVFTVVKRPVRALRPIFFTAPPVA